jgi:hypothetical protein
MEKMLDKNLLKDTVGWGILLWIIGYMLGILLFFVLPPSLIGWAIMPVGLIITFWVLFKKIKSEDFRYYIIIATAWTVIAVVFDYLFIVRLLQPVDGYYKLDVYLYYLLTFISPLAVGLWKKQ